MNRTAQHVTAETLEAGLDEIRRSPATEGRVELIVRRPAVDQRESLSDAVLDPDEGLVGDTWRVRGSVKAADGSAQADKQVTIMNARVASLVAATDDRRALAGDQFYVDLDISQTNLPPGSRLALGETVVEVSDKPHLGCHKFAARFGKDALRFVNSPVGRELRLRGLNARIVTPGRVRVGDVVRKISP
jgi:MOSC domain-containing protein YiiM